MSRGLGDSKKSAVLRVKLLIRKLKFVELYSQIPQHQPFTSQNILN